MVKKNCRQLIDLMKFTFLKLYYIELHIFDFNRGISSTVAELYLSVKIQVIGMKNCSSEENFGRLTKVTIPYF